MVSPSDVVRRCLAIALTVALAVVVVIVPVPSIPVPAMIMLVLAFITGPISCVILLSFVARANPRCAFIWRASIISGVPNITIV